MGVLRSKITILVFLHLVVIHQYDVKHNSFHGNILWPIYDQNWYSKKISRVTSDSPRVHIWSNLTNNIFCTCCKNKIVLVLLRYTEILIISVSQWYDYWTSQKCKRNGWRVSETHQSLSIHVRSRFLVKSKNSKSNINLNNKYHETSILNLF